MPGGGTWEQMNKVIPNIYVNVNGVETSLVNIGTRGVVAIAKELNWGPTDSLIRISDTSTIRTQLGYNVGSNELAFIRELFLGTEEYRSSNVLVDGATRSDGASEVIIGRLSGTGGVKATATVEPLTITAKYEGIRGNSITITITPDLDTETEDEGVYAVFIVRTIVDNTVVNLQRVGSYTNATTYTVGTVGDLVSNDWVDFSGTATAELQPTAGITLSDGVNPTVTNESYALFLESMERIRFNVLVYDGTDDVIKETYRNFVESLYQDNSIMAQVVTSNYLVDTDYVISVKNGYYIGDVQYPANNATWWVAGCEAGCPWGRSLTAKTHPLATRVDTDYTRSEKIEAIEEGSLALYEDYNTVKILKDINTLTTFTNGKVAIQSQNHAFRAVRDLMEDVVNQLAQYIDNYKNNENAWDLMKGDILGILERYLSGGAISDYDPARQIVTQGETADSVYVEINIVIGSFILKVYVNINVS